MRCKTKWPFGIINWLESPTKKNERNQCLVSSKHRCDNHSALMYAPFATLSSYSVAMNSLTATFTARICATRRDLLPMRRRSAFSRVATKLTPPRIVCMAVCRWNNWNTTTRWINYAFFLNSVELQEPYLITKLESAEKTWKELSVCMTLRAVMLPFSAMNFVLNMKFQVKLADPDVVSDPKEYQKLAQSVAELDEVLQFILLFIYSYAWKLNLPYWRNCVMLIVEQVVSIYRKFKDCEKLLEETKGLLNFSLLVWVLEVEGWMI